jgi:hypothetical protein
MSFITKAAKHGLNQTHLALYLCGGWAARSFIQVSGPDSVKMREIGIEHDALASNDVN